MQVAIVLAACAVAMLTLPACSDKEAKGAPPPLSVSVIKAVTTPVSVYEEYVAQTEATNAVEIRARVSGVLERQAFVDGSRVAKGELLFVIDQQPFIAALAQAKATLAQARANYANSHQILERIRPLLADEAISQQDLDTAVAREAADAASVEAARAQVTTAELNLAYTTIRAPVDGIISKALIKPGGLVNASTTLLTTLYTIDPIYVNFALSELKLLELERQLKAKPSDFKNRAPQFRMKLADGSDYPLAGRLDFVDAAVDPKSGTVQARLSVPNPNRLLRPGLFIRVIVPAFEQLEAIRVPQSAVQELQGRRAVFVVDAEGKVVYREVVAKSRLENDWVVEGGVNAGDQVIVEGINKVRPGMTVKPVLVAAGDASAKGANGSGPPSGPAKSAAKATTTQ